MRKLLSTTTLAAALALGGAAWAQSGSGAAPGGVAGSGGTAAGPQAQAGTGGTAGQGANQTGQMGQAGAQSAQSGSATDGQTSPGRGLQGAPRANTDSAPLSGTTGPSTVGRQTGSMMGEEQVRDMLSKQGFHNVENVTRSGNSYHARAMQNGRAVDLTIDANTGAITSQAAAR